MADRGASGGWRRLRAAGRPASFRRGEYLLVAGTSSDKVVLIEVGVVKVVLPGHDGADFVLNFLGAGELIGERGVLRARPRSAHVIALTDGYAVYVAAPVFLRLRGAHLDVLDLVDQTWERRQDQADARQQAAASDVGSRLVMSLLMWARDLGQRTSGGGVLVRGMSQRDIAQALGASEKSVEFELKGLRAAGLIRTGRLRYLITDPSALERRLAPMRTSRATRR